jgi:tetratricopeptide (TPR) repeat protein
VAALNRFNRPWYAHHRGWYHGSWGNWPGYPVFWADQAGSWLAPWAIGDSFVYANPYYDEPLYSPTEDFVPATGLDYSSPLPVPTADEIAETDSDTVALAHSYFDRSRAYFKDGYYEEATAEVDRALSLLPGDRTMQEFRALTLFARQKYSEAAAVLYAVLAAGPGWDWPTMASLYPNVATYTQQLRALEAYAREYPKDGAARFVLGYQYAVLDSPAAAVSQFRIAAKLRPEDKLSAQIADALSRQPTTANSGGE